MVLTKIGTFFTTWPRISQSSDVRPPLDSLALGFCFLGLIFSLFTLFGSFLGPRITNKLGRAWLCVPA